MAPTISNAVRTAADRWAVSVAEGVDAAHQRVVKASGGTVQRFMEFFGHADMSAVLKQLDDMRLRVAHWRSAMRRYAEQGKNAAGTPYDFDTWGDDGERLHKAAEELAGIAFDYSALRSLRLALGATRDELAAKTREGLEGARDFLGGALPWWVWAVGLVLLVVKLDVFARSDGHRRR